MQLLTPFGIERFYTDGWGGYTRVLNGDQHEVGKHFKTQLNKQHSVISSLKQALETLEMTRRLH